ncbi:MAG TPA: YciC family protein, partial [Actinomycetes bacterium]|nr:YciC family protein [Actinomycetes bacterium]
LMPPAGGPGMTLPPGWRPGKPEEKPGIIPLRPLGVDDFLSGTFATVRQQWRPLLTVSAAVAAIAAIVCLPILFAAQELVRDLAAFEAIDPSASSSEVTTSLSAVTDSFVSFLPWLALGLFAQIVAFTVIDAGSAIVVSRAVLGRDTTSARVISQLKPLLPRVLLLGVVLGIAILAGLFVCIVPGLVLSYLWFAAPASLTLEKGSVTHSMRRSWTLSSKSFWRVVGLILLVQVTYAFALQLVSAPISFLTSFGAFANADQVLSQGAVTLVLLGYLVSVLIGVLAYPIVSVARALLYLDLRMRHEGLAPALVEAAKPPQEA